MTKWTRSDWSFLAVYAVMVVVVGLLVVAWVSSTTEDTQKKNCQAINTVLAVQIENARASEKAGQRPDETDADYAARSKLLRQNLHRLEGAVQPDC